MSKLISFVGYSRVAGELKFRTAADEKRIAQLAKLGDTDINMFALPQAMTKSSAAKWALTAAVFAKCDETVFSLFTANAKDENPFKVAKAKKEVKVKVKVARAKKAKSSEPRELSARELAAMQFISFPVGNGGRAMFPNPLSKMSAAEDETAV